MARSRARNDAIFRHCQRRPTATDLVPASTMPCETDRLMTDRRPTAASNLLTKLAISSPLDESIERLALALVRASGSSMQPSTHARQARRQRFDPHDADAAQYGTAG